VRPLIAAQLMPSASRKTKAGLILPRVVLPREILPREILPREILHRESLLVSSTALELTRAPCRGAGLDHALARILSSGQG
jgi:hypothetical protein